MSHMRVWPSGHLIDPMNPDPEHIEIHDVAHHLAGELGAKYKPIEERVQAIIRERFHVTNRYADQVSDIDKKMCATEQRDLFGTSPVKAFDITIHPWSPEYAAQKFMRLFFLLKPGSLQAINLAVQEVA